MPWDSKKDCYGGRLCSIVGWLGYGGNLTWRKQEYFVEHVLGVPISQGSLAKMHQWFQELGALSTVASLHTTARGAVCG